MTPQAERTGPVNPEVGPGAALAGNWYYPTNQLNLMMNLAKGLFLPPEGFGDKYYADLLRRWPGWVPVFRQKVPAEAVHEVVTEAKHLVPVAVELDLGALEGNVLAVSVSGNLRPVSLADGVEDNDTLLLLPAPLPTGLVKAVYFHHKQAKDDFLQRARSSYKNVPALRPAPKVKKGLFEGRGVFPKPQAPERPLLPLTHADAAGGIRAMLLHYANRAEFPCRYYEWVYGEQESNGGEGFDPILRHAPTWIRGEPPTAEGAAQVRLYWDIVARIEAGPSGAGESYYDLVLQTLAKAAEAMADAKRRAALQGLAEDLRGLRGMSDQTLESLWQRHTKPFSRSLVLFFLREDCRRLLDTDDPALNETDYLAAAILCAVREGWSGLPLELRHGEAFGDAVGEWMAEWMATLVQQRVGSDLRLRLRASAPWIAPLYRLLAVQTDDPKGERRRAKQRLGIAKEMKWDCIYTTITLGKGLYPMEIGPAGVEIRFAGEPKTVRTEVDSEQFVERLARTWLSLEVEERVRGHL